MKQIVIFTLCLSFLFLSSIFTGCNRQSTEGDILPLAIGNQWIYSTGITDGGIQRYDTVTVVKDTMINNEKWFYLKHSAQQISWILLNKSDGLHIFDRDKGSSGLFLKYKSQKGDIFISLGDSVIVKDDKTEVKTSAGTFTCFRYNGIRIEYTEKKTDGGIYACPGVGVIRFKNTDWFDYQLVKYNLKK